MLIEVSKLSNLSASIASRVYPNNSLSGQLVQSGGTRDRGVNIVSVPTKSGQLATMDVQCFTFMMFIFIHLWHICIMGLIFFFGIVCNVINEHYKQ